MKLKIKVYSEMDNFKENEEYVAIKNENVIDVKPIPLLEPKSITEKDAD